MPINSSSALYWISAADGRQPPMTALSTPSSRGVGDGLDEDEAEVGNSQGEEDLLV